MQKPLIVGLRADGWIPAMLYAITAVLAAGCEAGKVPQVSSDGKRVAFAFMEPEKSDGKSSAVNYESRAIGVVNFEGGPVRRFSLPGGRLLLGFVWAGERLLIQAMPSESLGGKEEKPQEPTGFEHFVLDPSKGTLAPVKIGASAGKTPISIVMTLPFEGKFKGKPALYILDVESSATRAFDPVDLSEIGSLPFEAKGAGEGWMVREVRGSIERSPAPGGKESDWIRKSLPEDGATYTSEEILAVEVLDDRGQKTATIGREEIGKACFREPRAPVCARISSDRKTILLAFGTETVFRRHTHEYTYGVFDLKTGKLSWQGSSNGLLGIPILRGEKGFALEARERKIYTGDRGVLSLLEPPAPDSPPTDRIVLARHSAKGREVIRELDLPKGDLATLYSYWPRGNIFVLHVMGPKSRLLLVPVEDGATGAIREIPLDGAK